MATRVTSISKTKGSRAAASKTATPTGTSNGYVLPILHTRIPERLVQFGFWGGLVGVVVTGAVEAPLAALVGAAVVVARHRHKQ
jgi:hypothetical protein